MRITIFYSLLLLASISKPFAGIGTSLEKGLENSDLGSLEIFPPEIICMILQMGSIEDRDNFSSVCKKAHRFVKGIRKNLFDKLKLINKIENVSVKDILKANDDWLLLIDGSFLQFKDEKAIKLNDIYFKDIRSYPYFKPDSGEPRVLVFNNDEISIYKYVDGAPIKIKSILSNCYLKQRLKNIGNFVYFFGLGGDVVKLDLNTETIEELKFGDGPITDIFIAGEHYYIFHYHDEHIDINTYDSDLQFINEIIGLNNMQIKTSEDQLYLCEINNFFYSLKDSIQKKELDYPIYNIELHNKKIYMVSDIIIFELDENTYEMINGIYTPNMIEKIIFGENSVCAIHMKGISIIDFVTRNCLYIHINGLYSSDQISIAGNYLFVIVKNKVKVISLLTNRIIKKQKISKKRPYIDIYNHQNYLLIGDKKGDISVFDISGFLS